MAARGAHHPRPRSGDAIFADVVDEAHRTTQAGDGFADLGPGDLADHGSGTVLRHLDGALCRLAESDLEPDDARLCVRGGADVFVNPAGNATPGDVTCWPVESEFWIRNEHASSLAAAVPDPLDSTRAPSFDLFKGPDGEVVVMATGAFRWGPDLVTFATDGTTMPPTGVLLHEPLPFDGDDETALHVAGRTPGSGGGAETIRWVHRVRRFRAF